MNTYDKSVDTKRPFEKEEKKNSVKNSPEKDNKNDSTNYSIFCLKTKNDSKITTLSTFHKWVIYLTGLFEIFTFSGCVFGWSQLVYVLKNEEVFSDSCPDSSHLNETEASLQANGTLKTCDEQDKRFASVYIISTITYATSSIVAGMVLHHLGLVISRITASLMLIAGFLFLGSTNKDSTIYLYFAMFLLSVGGNQIRLSCFQFCNLFTKRRSTALTIISGSYSASAILFIVYQIGQYYGVSIWYVSLCLAGVASLSLVMTNFMPWHSVCAEDSNRNTKAEVPLKESLFTLSCFTVCFWLSTQILAISFYGTYFNPWISRISQTNEEAGFYSFLFSLSSFGCLIVTPFPGLLNDFLFQRASKATSLEEKYLLELKSPAIPALIVTTLSVSLSICLIFSHPSAIYVSLLLNLIIRPSAVAVFATFIRIRFPPEHFDRLNGICSTTIAMLLCLQYPFFSWILNSSLTGMITFICLLSLAFVHPFHLFFDVYLKRVVEQRMKSKVKKNDEPNHNESTDF